MPARGQRPVALPRLAVATPPMRTVAKVKIHV